MKIMILGSAGMLGHMVYYYLLGKNEFEIVNSSYPHKANPQSHILDVTDKNAVVDYIFKEKPDVVINCIGILIKGSNEDPSNAIYLNSFFPHQLCKVLRKTGGRLIHISTDCVFSGKKGAYLENDFCDADDIYGRSKSLGEIRNDHDLTLRTSIIGPELKQNGQGLFHWFMNQQGEIHGYTNAFWGGVTTLELSKAIYFFITHKTTGLVHITNSIRISKYELLILLQQRWSRDDLSIRPWNEKSADKSLRTIKQLYEVPGYLKMIDDLYLWMEGNSTLYINR